MMTYQDKNKAVTTVSSEIMKILTDEMDYTVKNGMVTFKLAHSDDSFTMGFSIVCEKMNKVWVANDISNPTHIDIMCLSKKGDPLPLVKVITGAIEPKVIKVDPYASTLHSQLSVYMTEVLTSVLAASKYTMSDAVGIVLDRYRKHEAYNMIPCIHDIELNPINYVDYRLESSTFLAKRISEVVSIYAKMLVGG